MGQLVRHPFKEWQRRYGLQYFVETGTWNGDGLMAARAACFQRLFSIEASPALSVKAGERMTCVCRGTSWAGRWEILNADSVEGIGEVLLRIATTRCPALWWLDAHLPERYDVEATRLPLAHELRAIYGHSRPHTGDVFLMDDLRLYERGPFASGNFPGGPVASLQAELKELEQTHELHRDYRDEGYLVALPRP